MVEFQIPVLLGYGGIDEDPVPIGAVGPVLEVEFQSPVLVGYGGRDAEAEIIGKDVVRVNDGIGDETTDDDDGVGPSSDDVAGFFAQSQSVN